MKEKQGKAMFGVAKNGGKKKSSGPGTTNIREKALKSKSEGNRFIQDSDLWIYFSQIYKNLFTLLSLSILHFFLNLEGKDWIVVEIKQQSYNSSVCRHKEPISISSRTILRREGDCKSS